MKQSWRSRNRVERPSAWKGLVRLTLLMCLVLIPLMFDASAQDTYREAYDAGFEDGRKVGHRDHTRRGPYDFANDVLYENGDRGFEQGKHERDVYVIAYRRGFEDGYENGYGLGESGPAEVSEAHKVKREAIDQRCRLPAGTEMEVRLINLLSTKRNERGDDFEAEVLEEVLCEEEVVIPVGTKVTGSITHLKRAGRIRGRSEMNLAFSELELPNRLKVPITATVVSIEDKADEDVKDDEGTIQGKSSKSSDIKRVGGGAGIGALIGVLTGGGKGAKIGAAVGAVAGGAGTLATRGDDIVLYPDTELIIKLNRDTAVSTEILRRKR